MMVLAVGATAAVGAVCRYLVDGAVNRRWASRLAVGTHVVNVSGSLALGFLAGLALYHGLGDGSRAVLGAGFLGAYTTFSTHSYETVRLLETGDHGTAFRHNLVAVVLGLTAATTGLVLAISLP
jgi:fluoride exporter